MKFTIATVVSLLAGSAIAAPTEMTANKATDMSAGASPVANMRLADMFSKRQMAVLKVLSEHQQELGMSQAEKDMLDAFMAALHGEAAVNVKRQAPVAAPVTTPTSVPDAVTALTPTAVNATLLGSLGSALDGVKPDDTAAPTDVVGAVGDAASGAADTAVDSATDVLNILKNIPALAGLLGNATGALGGATSGLGSATSGLSGLTGGLGGLTGGLGGLTGGLGGLLGGLLGGVRRGGLLGGIFIPGIL